MLGAMFSDPDESCLEHWHRREPLEPSALLTRRARRRGLADPAAAWRYRVRPWWRRGRI